MHLTDVICFQPVVGLTEPHLQVGKLRTGRVHLLQHGSGLRLKPGLLYLRPCVHRHPVSLRPWPALPFPLPPQAWETSLSFYLFKNFIYLFIYLFLAALGLCCCARVFSSCGERGLFFVAVRGLLIAVASLVVEHGSRHMGFSSCSMWAQ